MGALRSIEGRVALVTGASRGIGRALTMQLVREHGVHVYACARSHEDLLTLQEECEGSALLHLAPLDICDTEALDALFERIEEEQGGQLDFLINNASVLGPKEVLDMIEDEAWEHVLDVNLNGSFYVTKRALSLLRASGAPSSASPSLVIHLSSSVGRKVREAWGAYSISKYALEGLSALIAEEEDEAALVSVTLNPGGTATQMRAEAYPDEDPDSIPSAREVASTIVLLLRTLDASCSGKRYSSRALFELVDATSLDPGAFPSE